MGINPTYNGLGPVTGCTVLGIGNANGVYQLTPPGCQVCSFVFKGCFVDNATHLVPTLLSASVASVAACEAFAEIGMYDTYALQAGGQCWGGNNPPYAALGFGTSAQCASLGGPATNSVYQKTPLGCASASQQVALAPAQLQTCNWEYLGCWKDNATHLSESNGSCSVSS